VKTIKTPFTLLFGVMLLITSSLLSQAGKLPPFRMVQANGKVFKAEDLPMAKPIVIIYFSPECDHCEVLMKDLIKHKTTLESASIAMITHLPVNAVSKFVQHYKVANYKNIYVGTEGTTNFVREYYNITHMPFMALYTKNGNLVNIYRKEGELPELIKTLNNLK
jgi:thioredoxin-related protein